MSVARFTDGWHVVDVDGNEFDGPYAEQADAARAAYEIEHRLETLGEVQ